MFLDDLKEYFPGYRLFMQVFACLEYNNAKILIKESSLKRREFLFFI